MTSSMIVYVGLAIITTLLAQLEHLNSDELPNWTAVGWTRFVGYLLLSAFTTFKAYVSRPPLPVNGDILPTTQTPVGTPGAAEPKPADTGKT